MRLWHKRTQFMAHANPVYGISEPSLWYKRTQFVAQTKPVQVSKMASMVHVHFSTNNYGIDHFGDE